MNPSQSSLMISDLTEGLDTGKMAGHVKHLTRASLIHIYIYHDDYSSQRMKCYQTWIIISYSAPDSWPQAYPYVDPTQPKL